MATPKIKSGIKIFVVIKWVLVTLIFLSLPIFIYRYGFDLKGDHFARIEVGGQEFIVEIADTPGEKMLGLSGSSGLGEKEGMLFIFEEMGLYGFWMKDMEFPIDIVWIRGDEVIGFDANIKPDSYPTTYYPPAAVDRVLELPDGAVSKFGINPGAKVSVKKDS